MHKILLNTDSMRPPMAGIGRYTYQLLYRLKTHAAIQAVVEIPEYNHQQKNIVQNVTEKTKRFDWRKAIRSIPFAYQGLHYYRAEKFRRNTKKLAKQDFIYHETRYILNPYAGAKVCTVHDLSHIHYPRYHPKERVDFMKRFLPASIQQANHIITGSLHTRDEIIREFNVPQEKISVVYHGVDSVFRPREDIEIHSILASYGLKNQGYLLSVGTLEPRKNLLGLVLAYSQLPDSLRTQYPLVLVGSFGWENHELEKILPALMSKKQLYYLGYIPDEDLPSLYAGARAFAYLSFYEGFGLPLLEAMACKIPVLSSNTSSMPEVVGNGALLVDPNDTAMITEQLEQILTDVELRASLKSLALIQANQFSWEKCIEETIQVYNLVRKGL